MDVNIPPRRGSARLRRKRSARNRALAATLSAAIHGGVLLAGLSAPSGEPGSSSATAASTGAAETEEMQVSLVTPQEIGLSAVRPTASHGGLRILSTPAAGLPAPATRAGEAGGEALKSLFGRVERLSALREDRSTGAFAGRHAPSGTGHVFGADPRPNGVGPQAGDGGIWGQIEPCWRNLPGRSPIAVTLEVTVSAAGQITSPPIILRDGSPASEDRLQAEARAILALNRCITALRQPVGERIYRIRFEAESLAS